MKLLRFGNANDEKPGALDPQGNIRDLSGVVPDIGGAVLNPHSIANLRNLDLSSLPLVDNAVRLGPA